MICCACKLCQPYVIQCLIWSISNVYHNMKLRIVLQKDFLIFWTFFFLLRNSGYLFGNLIFLFKCPFPPNDDMVTQTCSSKQNNTAKGHQPRCESSNSNRDTWCVCRKRGENMQEVYEALTFMVMNAKGAYQYFQELPLHKVTME